MLWAELHGTELGDQHGTAVIDWCALTFERIDANRQTENQAEPDEFDAEQLARMGGEIIR